MTRKRTILIGFIVLLLTIAGMCFLIQGQIYKPLPEPTKFIFNKQFIIEEKIINNVGGEILIKKPNTPIDGIKIVFPVGTVSDNTKAKMGYYEGKWTLAEGIKNNFTFPLILLLDKKLNTNGQPIEIYKKSDMAFQVEDDTGRLKAMSTVNGITYTFRQKNIITFADFD